MMKKVICSFLNVLIVSGILVAQEPAFPESFIPGKRVRVTAPQFFQKIKISKPSRKKSRVVGTVVAANADTILLRIDEQSEPLIIPVSYLKKIEVSRGKKFRVVKGTVFGFLIGFATAEVFCAPFGMKTAGRWGPTHGIVVLL